MRRIIGQISVFAALTASICFVLPAKALTPSIEIKKDGFHNESSLSIVASNGNSRNQTFNIAQKNGYRFEANTLKTEIAYLRSRSADTESALNWGAGLRYERLVSQHTGAYVGQGVFSDRYAGIDLRYNSDIGVRYILINNDTLNWALETGYRYMSEHRVTPPDVFESLGRLYTEAGWKFSETSSTRYWIEYLPNITRPEGYMVNTEISLNTFLTSILSLKVAYLVKFNNAPPPEATTKYDTLVSTALVANF